jgi:Ca2+-binding RTX toxin-like protein
MADNTISTDQTATVGVNTTDESWLITKPVTITVADQYGILEGGSGNAITLLGDIDVSGAGFAGVRFQGSDTKLLVGAPSVIDATAAESGIQYEGAGGRITVNGVVKGGDYAINGVIWATLVNNGSLTGDNAVAFYGEGAQITNNGLIGGDTSGIIAGAGGTLIVNGNKGQILADSTGIELFGAGATKLVNRGLVQGDDVAISGGEGELTVINTGRIVGNTFLGDGNDVFDTRNGVFNSTVFGGDGQDTFWVSKTSTRIAELDAPGTDRVYSSASYKIGDFIEELFLIGGKNINGRGNDGDNFIVGNGGRNHLFGLDGSDLLGGGNGRDLLTGNDGADRFIFNQGNDIDRVTDFEDGIDFIVSDFVTSQQDFDDLVSAGRIKDVGTTVVINFGGGDKLILAKTDAVEIDINDFLI